MKFRDINSISPKNIRNISIISHVDHGKTTLSDHLLASGGIVPSFLAGSLRALDDLPEEQRRGITIETNMATYFISKNNEKYLINLIDTPGHVDFSGKVAESLRLVDGSLVIVDAVEGIMAQTKTVIKQAIKDRITFVLFINKIDRLILELELSSNKILERIQQIISSVRSLCAKYGMDQALLPQFNKGSVLLGSAMDKWAIDYIVANKGYKITTILSEYLSNGKPSISNEIEISKIINRSIISILPDPIMGQKHKFPYLIENIDEIKNETIMEITSCDYKNRVILLVGRQYLLKGVYSSTYLVRVLSGSVKRGDELRSSYFRRETKIQRIVQIQGRTKKDVQQLHSGHIGVINFSNEAISGDIITGKKIENILLKGISYVQEPVVGIVVEPLHINEISKIQSVIEKMVNFAPGLKFEINKDTGEMVILGVGTLQLDVLVNDLKNMNYEIYTSDPIILTYEIPMNKTHLEFDEFGKIVIESGNSNNLDVLKAKENLIYEDNNNNKLLIPKGIESEMLDGIIHIFRHSMVQSPKSGKKIKDFFLSVVEFLPSKQYVSYEGAIVLASKIMRKALDSVNSTVHEPFYHLEINLPEKYIGNIANELQRVKGVIQSIDTKDGESEILAILPVREGIKIADKFRHLTDGNVFWSFPSVKFLPI